MSIQDAGPFIKLYKDQIASLSAQLVEAKAEKTTLQDKVETATQDLLEYKGSHLIIEAEVASLKAQKIAGAKVSARKRGNGGGNSYKKVKPAGFKRELASRSNSFSSNSITNSAPSNTNRAPPSSVDPAFTCNLPTGPIRQSQHFVNNRVSNNFYTSDTTQSGKKYKLRKTVPNTGNSHGASFEANISEWASTDGETI